MSRSNVTPPAAVDHPDQSTADAFATSWNNLPAGSVYSRDQVEDWFAPLTRDDLAGKRVLEMGCGNGSVMVHVLGWSPAWLCGIDLGESVRSAELNLTATGQANWAVQQADLVSFTSDGFDVVYSIGVLHHLKEPELGIDAVLRNTKPGGRFHCWVYAREGNALVIWLVEPIRKIASRLPWWVTKYLIATPLVAPYFIYAKVLSALPRWDLLRRLPLCEYSFWIAQREFAFFRHVAFDQLVTPQTIYVERATIERWLQDPRVAADSSYIIMRNGNSWKFGGTVK
jgi:SAM-dependent methyltransferase